MPADDAPKSAEELDAAVEAALRALEQVDEEGEARAAWQALRDFEARCEAARAAGRVASVGAAIDQAVRLVRAFPEPWVSHADAATEVLAHRPARGGDPVRALWAAVEASRQAVEGLGAASAEEEGGEAAPEVRLALGLDVVVSLRGWAAGRMRLAAAAELPAEAPWTRLSRGPGWELVLTLDAQDRAVLLLAGEVGDLPFEVERDGERVEVNGGPEGPWCLAVAGSWAVRVADDRVQFRLAA